MNQQILEITQLIVAVFLVIAVLLQSRSSGLSTVFGGGGATTGRAKRGMEKYLFYATILLSIALMVLTLANVAGL
jgi:preprotein translocase subunit SecG